MIELENWNGVPMGDATIQRWIAEMISAIPEKIDASGNNWYTMNYISGNSLVSAQGYKNTYDNKYKVQIYVTEIKKYAHVIRG